MYFVYTSKLQNANIVGLNYRSYGRSSGKPSQEYLYSDANLIYDTLSKLGKIQPESLFIMGRSLGSGVATYLASTRTARGIILITPYDSMLSVAKEKYGFVPVAYLLQNTFPSNHFAEYIDTPALFVYGGMDSVIPPHHTENLMQSWKGEKESLFLTGANHENIMDFPEVTQSMNLFISR